MVTKETLTQLRRDVHAAEARLDEVLLLLEESVYEYASDWIKQYPDYDLVSVKIDDTTHVVTLYFRQQRPYEACRIDEDSINELYNMLGNRTVVIARKNDFTAGVFNKKTVLERAAAAVKQHRRIANGNEYWGTK